MGYTTDANYLIQAGKDIREKTVEANEMESRFESESKVESYDWGPFRQLGGNYDGVRDAAIACLRETVELLAAYAVALQATGAEYLRREELVKHSLGEIR